MGRKRKPVDIAFILKLHSEEKLSSRAIANRLGGISYKSIQRLLGQNLGTKSGTKSQRNFIVVATTEPPQALLAPTWALPSTKETSPPSVSRSSLSPAEEHFASLHRFWLSVAYQGTQPNVGEPITNKSHTFYRINTNDYTLDIHPNRLLIWIHNVKGTDSGNLKARGRGKARLILSGFAQERALSLDWTAFREIPVPEYVLASGPLNDALMEVLGTKKQEAEDKLGLIAGDSSDPDNIEAHHKVGEISLDSLYWLTHDFPDDWRAEKSIIKGFSENLSSHLSAIQELRDAVRELRDAIKERRV